jgi:hypothetical protein
LKKDIILLSVLLPAGVLMVLTNQHLSKHNADDKKFAATSPYPTMPLAQNPNIMNETENPVITPSASQNIEVVSPLNGDIVKPGFVVKGNARTFESTVNIRLLDISGNVLAETSTIANPPNTGDFGPFEKEIDYQTDENQGTLEIYQYSAKDGSEIDKVEIPLSLIR